MADAYNAEIRIPNYLEEATSMGAAILGGIGAGIFMTSRSSTVSSKSIRFYSPALKM
jgi:glycerol kinase